MDTESIMHYDQQLRDVHNQFMCDHLIKKIQESDETFAASSGIKNLKLNCHIISALVMIYSMFHGFDEFKLYICNQRIKYYSEDLQRHTTRKLNHE